jgi:hypothetical protein
MSKALDLKRAAQAYMEVFPKPEVQHSGEWGRLEGPRNEVWMMLHLYVLSCVSSARSTAQRRECGSERMRVEVVGE